MAVMIPSENDNKLEVRLNSSGHIAAYDTSGGHLVGTGSTVLSSGIWYRIEVKCESGASNAWEVKINGISEISGTGASLITTFAGVIGFGKTRNVNGNSVDFYYDDIFWSDSGYPGPGACKVLLPISGGTSQTWTIGAGSGSNWQQVDELPPDGDTSYLLSPLTIGNAETENVATIATSGITGTINSVKPLSILKQDTAGGTVKLQFVSNSTTVNTSSNYTATASYVAIGLLKDTDPATSAAWTLTALNTLQSGAVTETSSVKIRETWTGVMVDYTPASDTLEWWNQYKRTQFRRPTIPPTISDQSTKNISPQDQVEWYFKIKTTVFSRPRLGNFIGDYSSILISPPDMMEWRQNLVVPKPRPRLVPYVQTYEVIQPFFDSMEWWRNIVIPKPRPPLVAYTQTYESVTTDRSEWYVPQTKRFKYPWIKAPQVIYDLSTARTPFKIPTSPQAEAPAAMNIVAYAKGGWSQPKKSSGSFKKGTGALPQLKGIGVDLTDQAGTPRNIRIHQDTGLPVGKKSPNSQQIQATLWSPQIDQLKFNPINVTGTYYANQLYTQIYADATNGAFTIFLPPVASSPGGFVLRIKKIDSTVNVVTIKANASDTIEGSASVTLSARYKYYWLDSGAPSSPNTWFIGGSG